MDPKPAKNSPENDFALRLYYKTPIGEIFIHICEAKKSENARTRDLRVDLLLADLRHQSGYFDFLDPES